MLSKAIGDFVPTEVEMEPHFYLDWKLEIAQSWIQLSKVYNWRIINSKNECCDRGTFNGDLADLQLTFRKKVDGFRLMTSLTTDWIFAPTPETKAPTQEDFKDNPQAWRDRCRLLHLVRELDKMKSSNTGFNSALEEMMAGARKAIACLDAEVVAVQPKSKAKPLKG
jgi:hypothetical protein